MPALSDDVVIVGIGETPVGRLPGLSSVEIQAMAVLAALDDSGVALRDLDGVINLDPYATPQSMFAVTLAEYLGVAPRFVSTVDVGGTVTGMTMLQQACWAIRAGHCDLAVCVYGENTLSARAQGTKGLHMLNLLGGEEWEEPFGCMGMVIPYALLAQRYFDLYGAGPDDLGAVAVTTRQHALRTPGAQMRKPITLDDHRSARRISSPLGLLDCSLVSDGGGAVLLASRDRARQLRARPVAIRSMAMRATHNSIALMPDIPELGMAAAARDAFAGAGFGPDDLHVAELHDAFTISVPVTLEALGLCAPGGAGAFYRSGALSQAHIGGMLHITEAVRQLRGEAGDRQVPNATRAVVSGNGGVFSVCGVMTLETAA
jgi:acetyl-CoA acetyltransferase